MNFTDAQEEVFRTLGDHDPGQRPDHLRQAVKDAINKALHRIKRSTQMWWHDVREGTLDIVAGTDTYDLDDRCILPVGMWTEDQSAHEVEFVSPGEMDRQGLRNSSIFEAQFGPYFWTFAPRRTTPTAQGTGTVAEGSTTITRVSGTWTSAYNNKRIRLNGEDMDFLFTYGDANTGTLSRAYRARLTGNGTTGAGSGLTGAKWEISPPPVWNLEIKPTPNYSQTVHYRYVKAHSRLLNADDVLDLPEEFHHAVPSGALAEIHAQKQNHKISSMWEAKFQLELKDIRNVDWPTFQQARMQYASPIRLGLRGNLGANDQYRRR